MELKIINNKEESRIETHIESHIALIDYVLTPDRLFAITHTKVPTELEGRGIAAALTKFALEFAKENNYTVNPICPYTVAYMKKHTEYDDLLIKEKD